MGRRSEGGRPPRPRGLERKRLPGAEGPPEGKDKDAMLRSSLAAGGGAVVVVVAKLPAEAPAEHRCAVSAVPLAIPHRTDRTCPT